MFGHPDFRQFLASKIQIPECQDFKQVWFFELPDFRHPLDHVLFAITNSSCTNITTYLWYISHQSLVMQRKSIFNKIITLIYSDKLGQFYILIRWTFFHYQGKYKSKLFCLCFIFFNQTIEFNLPFLFVCDRGHVELAVTTETAGEFFGSLNWFLQKNTLRG